MNGNAYYGGVNSFQQTRMGFGFLTLLILLLAIIWVVQVISMWRLYKKAGEPGWGSIIPFYNTYILYKIVWGCGWWFLTLLIPFGGLIISIVTYVKLARCYQKGIGFGIGILIFPIIFLPVLAFGNSFYTGPQVKNKRGYLVTSIIIGVIVTALFCIMVGVAAYKSLESYDYIYSVSDTSASTNDSLNMTEDLDESAVSEIGTAENPSDFTYLTLNNGYVSISVPTINTDYSYNGESYIYWSDSGISVSSDLSYYDNVSVEDSLEESVQALKDLYNDREGYSEFSESNALTEDGLAIKLLKTAYTYSDGSSYDVYEIVKVEDVSGYNLVTEITIDMETASETAISNTLNAYGVSIN